MSETCFRATNFWTTTNQPQRPSPRSPPKTPTSAEPEADARPEASESAGEEFPKLALTFSSRRKGLAFSVAWEFADGKTRRAFGEKCLPVAELGDPQKENLVRLATMSRKCGFKYSSETYLLAEISKIPSFLQAALSTWERYFIIHKDANVDLLSLGERSVELKPTAKSVGGNSLDFDIEWSSTVGDDIIGTDEIAKIVGGGTSSLRIVPEYGILRISNDDTAFVRNVERAREFGFEAGKIPRYMLLSIAEFGGGISLSPELKKWLDSLSARTSADSKQLPDFLRNYQKRGVLWAKRLFDHDCNALIADEMGLGKTLQTLTLINMAACGDASKKFFVVCPASVIPVWISEAGKFFPNLKCGVLSASSDFADAQLWISSYTQLRRNRAAVEKIDFEIGVLDEAQFIKNPDAKTTAACMALKAKRKIALTGTPGRKQAARHVDDVPLAHARPYGAAGGFRKRGAVGRCFRAPDAQADCAVCFAQVEVGSGDGASRKNLRRFGLPDVGTAEIGIP